MTDGMTTTNASQHAASITALVAAFLPSAFTAIANANQNAPYATTTVTHSNNCASEARPPLRKKPSSENSSAGEKITMARNTRRYITCSNFRTA
jgi:hypothetical protein